MAPRSKDANSRVGLQGRIFKGKYGGAGSIPGRGAKIPHAVWTKNQNRKQKQYCNMLNKEI